MTTSFSLDPINGASPIINPAAVRSGFTVTGSMSAGQVGIVTLTENRFTIKKVVQADSHGHFSLNLGAGDASHFGTGTLDVQLQTVSTTVPPSLLQLFVNTPSGNLLYAITGSTHETIGVTDTVNANGDNYWSDGMLITAAARGTTHVTNFNSEDWTPPGFNFEDQSLTLDVRNATSISFYIDGGGGNDTLQANKSGDTEIDVYLGGMSTHGVTAPSFVITGDLGDVDGDNIYIVGSHYNFNVNYGSSPDPSVSFFYNL